MVWVWFRIRVTVKVRVRLGCLESKELRPSPTSIILEESSSESQSHLRHLLVTKSRRLK